MDFGTLEVRTSRCKRSGDPPNTELTLDGRTLTSTQSTQDEPLYSPGSIPSATCSATRSAIAAASAACGSTSVSAVSTNRTENRDCPSGQSGRCWGRAGLRQSHVGISQQQRVREQPVDRVEQRTGDPVVDIQSPRARPPNAHAPGTPRHLRGGKSRWTDSHRPPYIDCRLPAAARWRVVARSCPGTHRP